ncbi:MAG: metalloregulator ArsR/SmtB family transcription factor [Syntrophomonadaceae bacterium]
MIEKSARVLKALGEPTRLKIIRFLWERELCICELVAILEMSQPRISQHVKVLKQAGLIKERRVRQNSYLSLNIHALNGTDIASFSTLMTTEIVDVPELKEETQRFQALDCNETVICCKTGGMLTGEIQLSKIV